MKNQRRQATNRPNQSARQRVSRIPRACGKVRYRDHQQAVEALHSAQNARSRQIEESGVSSRHECRIYECDRCCGHHLTSRQA